MERKTLMYEKIKIDDNFINEIARYFEKQGECIQNIIDDYIIILNKVRSEGITGGETSDALKIFNDYVEKLNQVVYDESINIKKIILKFMLEIDVQDKYIY